MSTRAIVIIAGAWLAVACSTAPRAVVGTENGRRNEVPVSAVSAGAYDDLGRVTMASGVESWRMEASAAPVP